MDNVYKIGDGIIGALIETQLQVNKQQEELTFIGKKVRSLAEKIDQINESVDYFTIIGYLSYRRLPSCSLKEAQKHGKEVIKLSKKMCYKTSTMQDARYGRVKTYHKDVLDAYFSDLMAKII